MLPKLKDLIKELTSTVEVQRFKQLEALIDQDEILKKDYENLKNKQKLMVNAEHKKSANLSQLKEDYNKQLELVNSHVLLSEYLDLLESINNDLQLIKDIITSELNMDID